MVEVLNIDLASIGLDDDFFQLGGDSIAAMRVVGEARKLRVVLSVAAIFRQPTLRHLAQFKASNGDQLENGDNYDNLVDPIAKSRLLSAIDSLDMDICSGEVADILPITQFQEDKILRGIQDTRQFCNYFYLDLGPRPDIPGFEKNCSLTLQRYPILRAYFLQLLGKFWQVVPRQLDLPVRILDVDQDLDESFNQFCLKDIEELSPTRPPVGFALLRRSEQGVRFVLRISHAQYDGISLPTIIRSFLGSTSNEIVRPPSGFLQISRVCAPSAARVNKILDAVAERFIHYQNLVKTSPPISSQLRT